MTFTKDQLIEQAREKIKALKMSVTQSAFKDIRPELELDLALAEMALAGMEAEPVIIVGDDGGDALAYRRLIQTFAPGTKLYTAPQPLTTSERAELENYRNAQQVVPDERVAFESFMEKRLGDVVDRSRALNGDNEYMAWDMAVGWIAWQGRAAMQSGAVKDGWVDCSERMPSDKEYVWCWGVYDDQTEADGFEGYYDASRGKWWASNNGDYVDGGFGGEYKATVTHWQPLPAAPQQES